ncbi:T-cell surface glycoprotein CD1b2 [Camelus dromedarius]|uniref:T-cell surface glycoprotein CD1b2 n=1 Tax=Camelus dromedarius TaxID=9838 RepID=A0A5N4CPC8_CAMDR|nr:T-cell surface glycoprotein CD1b2 [Camelus dromedarius]
MPQNTPQFLLLPVAALNYLDSGCSVPSHQRLLLAPFQSFELFVDLCPFLSSDPFDIQNLVDASFQGTFWVPDPIPTLGAEGLQSGQQDRGTRETVQWLLDSICLVCQRPPGDREVSLPLHRPPSTPLSGSIQAFLSRVPLPLASGQEKDSGYFFPPQTLTECPWGLSTEQEHSMGLGQGMRVREGFLGEANTKGWKGDVKDPGACCQAWSLQCESLHLKISHPLSDAVQPEAWLSGPRPRARPILPEPVWAMWMRGEQEQPGTRRGDVLPQADGTRGGGRPELRVRHSSLGDQDIILYWGEKERGPSWGWEGWGRGGGSFGAEAHTRSIDGGDSGYRKERNKDLNSKRLQRNRSGQCKQGGVRSPQHPHMCSCQGTCPVFPPSRAGPGLPGLDRWAGGGVPPDSDLCRLSFCCHAGR